MTNSSTGRPRVSVVIPTFNRARDIGRCLDSLVRQTFRRFEVLVCDDGSTDGTAKIVEQYKDKLDLTYHWAENFGGPARPRNIGISLARGDYVAFLDSDDWWTPRKLEESLKCLEQGADVVYHDLYLADRAAQRFFWRKSRSRNLRSPVFDDLIVNGPAINNSSVVMKLSVLHAIEGFSEQRAMIAVEDFDAWLRASRVTDAFVRIPETLGYYWIGDGNLSNPQRTVKNLEAIEERYSRELTERNSGHDIYWLDYVKARSHYLVGSYGMARSALLKIRAGRLPTLVRCKIAWMLMMAKFHQIRART